jgi:excisionase family DNA binding protein
LAEEELLTPAEAARRLRASEETIRRWLRADPPKIRGVQLVTGRWRIPASEVDRMLAGIREVVPPDDYEKRKKGRGLTEPGHSPVRRRAVPEQARDSRSLLEAHEPLIPA